MHKNAALQIILKVVSVLITVGGAVRLVANKQTFQSFLIGELWVDHSYFVYIYRVLGAFSVFVGITVFCVAQDPAQYSRLFKVWGLCFLFIAIVMFLAGYFLHMSFVHYGFDFAFCVLIALVCFSLSR
ncbi:hypothetical protein AMJ87_05220 [candidate division WOR_3 bacterium SM23_60]|uniref:Uncharacterized protein n=1 Tax=candidate division WOR_3 bacterium SM23_60 TaxID=1703780 RepID=A0A0S8GHR0_UNCW3|nr:MAG: hypothetical protein AMJ87_05220 [candidate division WOR_3 bacterium SM23_60]